MMMLIGLGLTLLLSSLSDIDAYYVSAAETQAAVYARVLSNVPPEIRVEIEESAVEDNLNAHVVRSADGTCVAMLRRRSLRRPDILAHEVCHCVNDYRVMGPYGFRAGLPHPEVVRREAAAVACGEELRRQLGEIR